MKEPIKFNHVFKNGTKKESLQGVSIPYQASTVVIYKNVLKDFRKCK